MLYKGDYCRYFIIKQALFQDNRGKETEKVKTRTLSHSGFWRLNVESNHLFPLHKCTFPNALMKGDVLPIDY